MEIAVAGEQETEEDIGEIIFEIIQVISEKSKKHEIKRFDLSRIFYEMVKEVIESEGEEVKLNKIEQQGCTDGDKRAGLRAILYLAVLANVDWTKESSFYFLEHLKKANDGAAKYCLGFLLVAQQEEKVSVRRRSSYEN